MTSGRWKIFISWKSLFEDDDSARNPLALFVDLWIGRVIRNSRLW